MPFVSALSTMNENTNGKPDYRIDQAILDAVDPLAPTNAEFDWHSLYLALGEVGDWEDDDLNTRTAQAMRRIFEWVCDITTEGRGATRDPEKAIGRRFLALAWVIRPDYFEGAPSIRELAARLGVPHQNLCPLTGEAAREFGIANMAQGTRPNYKGSRHPQARGRIYTPPPRSACPRTIPDEGRQANTPAEGKTPLGGTQIQSEAVE